MLSKRKICVKVWCALHEFETLEVSSNYFSRKRSFELHELVQHEIVVLTLKQDLACVHFVETTSRAPNINLCTVRQTQTDFGCTIESGDKIRRGCILRIVRVKCRSKITNLDCLMIF